ncbi:heme peroxidase 2-like [Crassostrea angulata]|uniref:heme peroxidase 2-like n=1 Tax=Magallana angulata TaxID=2784310 RepID=UPI0022B0FE3C|nr:heme peroxidase 2-like [Crassostrea angulata]
MYIGSSIFFCVLLCINSSWASLGQSRMNSLLSETMNEPSVAKRPDFQLQSVPNGRQLNPFNKAIRPSRFDPGQFERPSLSFDQAAIRPRQFDVMADPLTPSVAEVRSAINEVKALNQKEAQVNRELFEQKIDTPNLQMNGFGPHLLTTPEAMNIAEQSATLIGSVARSIQTVQSKSTRARNIGGILDRSGSGTASNKDILARIPLQQNIMRQFKQFCPYQSKPTCVSTAKYRTADGSCNNLQNPLWGKSQTPFERFMFPFYEDDVQDPRSRDVNGRPLPGPREISNAVHQRSTNRHVMDLSQFTMEFGQFVSHDIQFNALAKGYRNSNLECCKRQGIRRLSSNCLPISLPKDDPYFATFKRTCMNFVRSLPSAALDCSVGPRQQINQNTHYLDGSAVYGSDQNTMNSLRLRRDGLLKSSSVGGKELLSQDTSNSASCRLPTNDNKVKCFKAGDRRVNQQPALISLQTIWHREHNRIAKKLKTVNPKWNDETLFQETRKIVGAMIQHITYHSYLQEILGNDIMNKFDLKPKSSGYFTEYNAKFKAMIRNVFSTAAFRFGHSMINDKLSYHPTKAFSTNVMSDLRNIVLKPDWIYRKDGGVGAVTKGLYETNAQSVDMRKSYEVTRHLFEAGPGTGIDLAAINIQRGRDHGLAPYNVWRSVCQLQPATTFTTGAGGLVDHPQDAVLALKSIYKSVDDIDLFTGGVSEKPLPGAQVGPLFACIIGLQFKALKYGDRFYYENDDRNVKFTTEQLNEIRNTLMANVICRNTDISKIHRNVFEKKTASTPEFSCSEFKNDIDFTKWNSCVPKNGGWSSWRQIGRGCVFRRVCNNPTPNKCGKPCTGSSYRYECGQLDLTMRAAGPRRTQPISRNRFNRLLAIP